MQRRTQVLARMGVRWSIPVRRDRSGLAGVCEWLVRIRFVCKRYRILLETTRICVPGQFTGDEVSGLPSGRLIEGEEKLGKLLSAVAGNGLRSRIRAGVRWLTGWFYPCPRPNSEPIAQKWEWEWEGRNLCPSHHRRNAASHCRTLVTGQSRHHCPVNMASNARENDRAAQRVPGFGSHVGGKLAVVFVV